MNYDEYNSTISKYSQYGLPMAATNANLATAIIDDNNQAVFNAINEFLQNENSPTGLYLYGKTGVGKTHALFCLANACIQQHRDAWFCTDKGFTDALKATFNTTNPVVEKPLAKLRSAPLLIWDDFGATRRSTWYISIIHDIIATRHDAKLPTIISSQIYPRDFLVAFKDEENPKRVAAIIDTLRASVTPIHMDGPSRR